MELQWSVIIEIENNFQFPAGFIQPSINVTSHRQYSLLSSASSYSVLFAEADDNEQVTVCMFHDEDGGDHMHASNRTCFIKKGSKQYQIMFQQMH